MNSESRICRICLTNENAEEFTSIFEKGSDTAAKIFLVSGVKVNKL